MCTINIITPNSHQTTFSHPRSSSYGLRLGRSPIAWGNVKEPHNNISTTENETSMWCCSFGNKLTSDTVPQPRRTETTATLPIKPKNSHCASDIRTSVSRSYPASHVGKKQYLFLDCIPTRFVLSVFYSVPLNTSRILYCLLIQQTFDLSPE